MELNEESRDRRTTATTPGLQPLSLTVCLNVCLEKIETDSCTLKSHCVLDPSFELGHDNTYPELLANYTELLPVTLDGWIHNSTTVPGPTFITAESSNTVFFFRHRPLFLPAQHTKTLSLSTRLAFVGHCSLINVITCTEWYSVLT